MRWMQTFLQCRHQVIPLFWFLSVVSFTFLGLTYIIYDTHQHTHHVPYLQPLLFKLLHAIWILIFLERWCQYIVSPVPLSWRQLIYQYILASLFPPLRLSHIEANKVWFFGWKPLTSEQIVKIEQTFTYPALLIALLTLLPITLLMLWIPNEFVKNHAWLMHAYLLSMSFVVTLWLVELIIMLGISSKPLQYLANHWLDILIFIYPLAIFNRLIQVFGLQAYYNWVDNYIVRFMSLLKIVFLGLSAILIQYYQTDEAMLSLHYREEMLMVLLGLWAIFAVERLIYLALCPNKTWKSFVAALFIVLFPPLHLAARRCHSVQYIWYFSHWELVREALFEKIERQFLFWIVIILLIMSPFWIVELFFSYYLKEYILLQHVINIGNAIVWAVFVSEIIIEISITKKWQQYLIQHWVELLIILLPMLAFARFLRMAHLGSLSKLSFIQRMIVSYTAKWQKLLNIYRTRSTLNRLIRIFILVDVIRRWQQKRNPQQYLRRLQEQLNDKQQEIDDIKKKIADTQKLINDEIL